MCWSPVGAYARPISLIRDAEIENTIRTYATPVFEAAGLDPKAIKLYLINDSTLNAFVAGGQNLFMNTGLLMQATGPDQVIGVIAHETGHIAGGHLARLQNELAHSTAASILAMVLGGAAILAGKGDAGAAVIAGGTGIAQRQFLAYSRSHEGSADQAAMKYLDMTHQSARGLLTFMKKLENEELLYAAHQDPYLLTHPLTKERIDAIQYHVDHSPYSDVPPDPKLVALHARMRAKLIGYMTPQLVAHTFKRGDNSLPARYAWAIAYFRTGQMDKFLPAIDALLAEHPDDPYFNEVKGQALWEHGDGPGALKSYTKAVALLPDNDLLRRDLARVQIAVGTPAEVDSAIDNLKFAAEKEKFSPSTMELLGNAYYKKGDEPRARLYHADAAFLKGQMEKAIYNGEVAARAFREGSAEWLRAKDIVNAARIQQQKQEDRR